MRFARFFIDRPVFAAVISIAITLVGGIALLRLAGPDGPTGAAATAPEASEPDLKAEPPARQVRAITVCGDTYRVATEDGGAREFWERNLRHCHVNLHWRLWWDRARVVG